MRRFGVFLLVEVVLWAVVVVADMLSLTSLYTLPVMSSVLGVSLVLLIALLWPNIRAFFDPAERVIRQSAARRKSEEHQRLKSVVSSMLANPLLRDIDVIDPAIRHVVAKPGFRGDCRHSVMGRATWLVNHGVVPDWLYLWLAERLGYKIEMNGEDPKPSG